LALLIDKKFKKCHIFWE